MRNSMNFISHGPTHDRWLMPQLELRRSFAMAKSMPWATSLQVLRTMEEAPTGPMIPMHHILAGISFSFLIQIMQINMEKYGDRWGNQPITLVNHT